MPVVIPTSAGVPGSTITAADLNSGFNSFSITLDESNIRVDAVHNSHLSLSSVNGSTSVAKNINSALTAYTGNTYQAITHGTTPLTTGSATLLVGQTFRVHWHQYVDEIVPAAFPVLDNDAFTAFQLEWDIGAGYTTIPDLLVWACSGVGQTSTSQFDNRYVANMTGSWAYTNTTGSAIAVSHVRLTVKPCSNDVLGAVKLGEGTIFSLIQGAS